MDKRNVYITKMIIAVGLCVILGMLMLSSAQAASLNDEKPYRTEEFSVQTPGNLKVRTSGGSITVEGSNGHKVRVEMYVTKNGRTLSPSDTDLNNFDIRIEQDGDSIVAIAKRKSESGWKFWKNINSTSVSFVVYTPKEMSTNLRTSGGHIQATSLTGKQQIRTSGGHLELADLKGRIHARTSGGHIEISDIDGEMNARTSGGHIEAKNTKGSLDVHTSGGHISLENIMGTVEASTSGGSITADIHEMGKFAKLHTSGGSIHLTVPGDIGMDLDLHGNRVHTQLKNFSGSMEKDDVKGTINGGGPELSASTSGGSVYVSFQ